MASIEEVDVPKKQTKQKRGKHAFQRTQGTPTDSPPPLVKYYLVLYNILSALGWSYVLLTTLVHLFDLDGAHSAAGTPLHAWLARIPYLPAVRKALARSTVARLEASLPAWAIPVLRRAGTAYARVGRQTAFVQSWAALEVLHVLLGWVRSPLVTTLIQVGSRLYLVWGVTDQFPQTHTNPLYASMVLSWSLTEVVRYTFYACNLLGSEPAVLLFLRYTLFYVLYPTGASSEALLIHATIPYPGLGLGHGFGPAALHTYVRQALFLVWWPGLYVMYTHMMKQRRKVFGGAGRTLGAKPKSL
ncbi:PTPLA-domain-containing protein [Trametes meyenii]|nr:PTPLA-domain-containing protein [Trametes meyenii]